MTIPRLRGLILILLSALGFAACSSVACRSANPPVYPDSDRPAAELHEAVQK